MREKLALQSDLGPGNRKRGLEQDEKAHDASRKHSVNIMEVMTAIKYLLNALLVLGIFTVNLHHPKKVFSLIRRMLFPFLHKNKLKVRKFRSST